MRNVRILPGNLAVTLAATCVLSASACAVGMSPAEGEAVTRDVGFRVPPKDTLPSDEYAGECLTDSDGDGVSDCNDGCPEDPLKFEEDFCGCGVPDDSCLAPSGPDAVTDAGCLDDSDGDGADDCTDDCPGDPDKVERGVCGCGEWDVDSDGDGLADCHDPFPEDPETRDTCDDRTRNGGEMGVDCGGPCDPCSPSCVDDQQNQDETGIDCGGPCDACPPSCTDGLQNQDEAGIDCGGGCSPCAGSCVDAIQNQGETGIDCGGPCPDCPTCHDAIRNQGETGVDCGGPCPDCPTCHDAIRNQGETGVDCGGPCPDCPTCHDAIRNQGETGVDCGGPCTACDVGGQCTAALAVVGNGGTGYGPCEGDCDSDSDCAGGLRCFQVRTANGGMQVPGCNGRTIDSNDFCYDPDALGITLTAVFVSNGHTGLRECESDCDEDSDCLAGLVCWQNEERSTSVPGCLGVYDGYDDFCVDPAKAMCE